MNEQSPKGARVLPQWVGEGDYRQDVSGLSDRGIAIKSLDVALRMAAAVQHCANQIERFRKEYTDDKALILRELPEIPAHRQRIAALERRAEQGAFDARQSSHDWNELLTNAGSVLSQRVKDPRDRLDSNRAREIAKEVFEGAKVAEDAKAFRTWKSRGVKVVLEIAKWVIPIAVGLAAGHLHWI